MPKNSQAKLDANHRYNQKTYETISTRARRVDRVNDLIEVAAERAGKSKAAYILEAIRGNLERDGISAADLPQLDDTKKGGGS